MQAYEPSSRETTLPPDPQQGDAVRGREIAARGIAFDEPPAPGDPGPHAFAWLRDLRSARTIEAQDASRRLVVDWIGRYEKSRDRPWWPVIAAERLVNWIYCHRLLVSGADAAFLKQYDVSLGRHVKRLRKLMKQLPHGAERFAILKALVYAGVSLPGHEKSLSKALIALQSEIEAQILPDGGHHQRNPSIHAAVLSELVQLAAALELSQDQTLVWLQSAIDRMAPVLRFFQHNDGSLALFNGSAEEDPATVERLLATCMAGDKTPASLPDTGYQRLDRGHVVVLVDTGAPPPRNLDIGAHASTLSFEMSVGAQRLIVNCGSYHGDDKAWSRAMRSTAAHSTLIVANTNSSEVHDLGGIGRRPETVTAERDDVARGLRMEASHDGYVARYGMVHRRRLELSADGRTLRGEDRLERKVGSYEFVIRFHIHPDVVAAVEPESSLDNPAVALRLPGGQIWRFRANSGAVALDESAYLGWPGSARATRQITVSGACGGVAPVAVSWSLSEI
ncbi:MAG TPA: heparinase II/III family protein [Alphaproteobacteria bacterium]|nr:heparinase II/III family protein [Alphaproteobacteria bacterium]